MDHDRNIKYNNRGSIKQQCSEQQNESVALDSLKYDKAAKRFVWWAMRTLSYFLFNTFIIFSPQIKVVYRKKEKKTVL